MNYEKASTTLHTLENRSMERFDLELPAKVETLGQDIPGTLDICTKDVCAGGAFFKSDCSLPEGAPVKVVLMMPLNNLKKIKGKTVHISVNGRVVRNGSEGFAVCFEPEYTIDPT